ncbi:lysoplasmalogenase [Brachybacterium vulturis]|uniref:Lysoplasmalogenase n=1 Tax=Brachybacterium vulturis TaxID=2017484 RepID=A0A291GMY1_9MICO|nr:lysoplasmalogenase [Brachybacterium vulturis]ATG51432.1 lysoplasmalogenase [Brachybacterium vulturis]
MRRSIDRAGGDRSVRAAAASASALCGALLCGIALVHLAAQLLGNVPLAGLTQVLLMPLLAAALWAGTTAPRPLMVRLALVALGFSWLGDVIPRFVGGEPGFLGMLGSFLVAQLVFALAFWPRRGRSVLRSPLKVLPYLAVAVSIIVLCAPGAGSLLPTVTVYAAAIGAMAVLATGMGRRGGLGGALFVLSDALIALRAFGVLTLPAHETWVMATYITAQVLLILAVRSVSRTDPPEGDGTVPGGRSAERRRRG